MDWILICECCKFGAKICYNSRNKEFFLWVYLFWCTLYIEFICRSKCGLFTAAIFTLNTEAPNYKNYANYPTLNNCGGAAILIKDKISHLSEFIPVQVQSSVRSIAECCPVWRVCQQSSWSAPGVSEQQSRLRISSAMPSPASVLQPAQSTHVTATENKTRKLAMANGSHVCWFSRSNMNSNIIEVIQMW